MTSTFEVLAEESRRRILDLLVEEERPVGDLVEPAVAEPARRLQAPQGPAGGRPGRGPASTPSAGSTGSRPEPLREVDEWLAPYRRRWAAHLNALERHLEIMDGANGGERGHEQRRRVGDARRRRRRRSVLRYRRRLAHPPQKVWRALTEDGHLRRGSRRRSRASAAPARRCTSPSARPRQHPSTARCSRSTPPSVMELRWADDVLRFELEPGRTRACVLRLTVTFPEHGKAARDGAGWHVCLEQLAAVCDGTAPPWQPPDRWRVVHRSLRRAPRARGVGDRAARAETGTRR